MGSSTFSCCSSYYGENYWWLKVSLSIVCRLGVFYSTIFNELLLFGWGKFECSTKKDGKKWFSPSYSLKFDGGGIFEANWESGSWNIGISSLLILSTLGLPDLVTLLFDFTDFSLYFLLLTDISLSSTLPRFLLLLKNLELISWWYVVILHFESALLILK